ncbi:MAG: LCP family protein [Clostridium sp.]
MGENSKRSGKNKKRKPLSKKQKIVISILSVLGVLILVGGAWLYSLWNAVYEPSEKPQTSNDVEYEVVEGITNVLLIGTDGRTLDEASRSDSIIIATLDANQQKTRLTSINRDTLVEIPGHGQQKINAAYAFGGHELLMETISKNFDIKLDKYVAINFWGFENVIDEIGGIEVDVEKGEIEELNKFIGESTGGATSPMIKETGVQTLDGQQALSYARIRKNDSGYNRDSRQREVLFKVAEELKSVNPIQYPFLLNALKDQVKTNIKPDEAFSLGYTIYKMPVLDIQQVGMPLIDTETGVLAGEGRLYKEKGWVVLTDLKQMGKLMNKFINEGVVPTLDDVDYGSLNSVLADFRSEEKRYNSVNGINPEDHATEEDKEKENIPAPKPDTKPEVPDVKPEVSNTKPVINGVSNKSINVGSGFNPLSGVSASDKEDGNLSGNISVSGSVNTAVAGKYTLTYSVTDSDGNTTSASCVVTVVAPTPPPTEPGEGEETEETP